MSRERQRISDAVRKVERLRPQGANAPANRPEMDKTVYVKLQSDLPAFQASMSPISTTGQIYFTAVSNTISQSKVSLSVFPSPGITDKIPSGTVVEAELTLGRYMVKPPVGNDLVAIQLLEDLDNTYPYEATAKILVWGNGAYTYPESFTSVTAWDPFAIFAGGSAGARGYARPRLRNGESVTVYELIQLSCNF